MSDVIIYKQPNGVISVMTPAPDMVAEHGITAIAIKDVPMGHPFKIMRVDELPLTVPQTAWTIEDADLNDGIGGLIS